MAQLEDGCAELQGEDKCYKLPQRLIQALDMLAAAVYKAASHASLSCTGSSPLG